MTDPVRRPSARTASVHFRTTPEALDSIKRQADREHRSFSDMIRVLIIRGMEASQ